jgi:hypothetical protein
MPISFTKTLRDPIRRGEITLSVRYWHRPRVKEGQRYPMEEGWVRVNAVRQIQETDLTDDLARQSGFADLQSMLKIAQHGASDLIWLVEFTFEPGESPI